MKNCNIGRGIAVLLTSTILLGGCEKVEETKKEEIKTPEITTEECERLIVDFGNQTVIFKECEGYEIYCRAQTNSGLAEYTIKDNNDTLLISGYTTEFNDYTTSHNQVDEIEQKAIDNGAYVYKLQK